MESILTQTKFPGQFPHRISLSQAAKLSGYHQDYLGQLCRLGKLRAAKIGRNWYTTKSELQSLLDNSEAYGALSQIGFTDHVDQNGPTTEVSIADDYNTDDSITDGSNTDVSYIEPSNLDVSTKTYVNVVPVKVPVVSANYVISQVEDMPITLEQRPQVANNHHTLQTLITRMKLEELKTEVLQVTGLIDQISDEVAEHSQILRRHEKLLQTRTDLRSVYSPTIGINSARDISLLEDEQEPTWQNQINTNPESRVVWLWPALTLLVAVIASSLFVLSSYSTNEPLLTTIIYQPKKDNPAQQNLAGANTSADTSANTSVDTSADAGVVVEPKVAGQATEQ